MREGGEGAGGWRCVCGSIPALPLALTYRPPARPRLFPLPPPFSPPSARRAVAVREERSAIGSPMTAVLIGSPRPVGTLLQAPESPLGAEGVRRRPRLGPRRARRLRPGRRRWPVEERVHGVLQRRRSAVPAAPRKCRREIVPDVREIRRREIVPDVREIRRREIVPDVREIRRREIIPEMQEIRRREIVPEMQEIRRRGFLVAAGAAGRESGRSGGGGGFEDGGAREVTVGGVRALESRALGRRTGRLLVGGSVGGGRRAAMLLCIRTPRRRRRNG